MASTDLLSDKAVQAAIKAAIASGKPRKISDGGGLLLEARPTGSGWWRLRYSMYAKEGMISLGTYPEIRLKCARQRRDEARRHVAKGIDPSALKKAGKAERKAKQVVEKLAAEGKPLPGTFEAVARDWLGKVHEKKVTAGHSDRTAIRFEQDVFPWIGKTDIASVEAPELLEVLRKVIARGAIETAHRIKDACGQVFRFGLAEGRCKRNPAADLRDALPPVPTRHFSAIIEPKQATGLLQSMMEYKGSPVTKSALQLSALLFLRPGELRQLEWAWLDRDESVIRVPSTLMKRSKDEKVNGKPHIVPLSQQSLAVLNELQPLTGHGRYLFPSLLTGERPMSENTVRTALRRMGYSNEDMTPHGFRAMARTMAAERLGIAPEVIEAQLAHTVADDLGRAYNRTQFLDQRRELMTKWADYLDILKTGNVVSIAEARAA